MQISTHNEWNTLKSIVVGIARGANKPEDCHFETLGTYDKLITLKADNELNTFVQVLEQEDVIVYRPNYNDFTQTKGMYNYCPRDRLLIVGDTIIDCNMQYDCREQETKYLDFVTNSANKVIKVPREEQLRFDAANVCRIDDTLLYLVSPSGTPQGAEWLQQQFPNYKVEVTHTYGGIHIDSTFIPVRQGLVVINKDRVNYEQVPKCFKEWDIIWLGNNDLTPKQFSGEAFASNYIQLNFLMINPKLAVIDDTPALKQKLLEYGVLSHTVPFTHSRTLGGGHHCVTLDLHREK